jgi:flagellar protein FlaG
MMISPTTSGFAPARAAPDERPSPPPAPPPAEAVAAPVNVPAPEQVKQAAQMISRAIQTLSRNLQFSLDDATGKTVVRVVDTETGETVRQIPSAEMLDISRTLDRLQGLLIRQKA